MKKTPFQTLDEFTYMASLMQSPLSKTQVIERHAQEKITDLDTIIEKYKL